MRLAQGIMLLWWRINKTPRPADTPLKEGNYKRIMQDYNTLRGIPLSKGALKAGWYN